jgi:hypothetical protein
VRQPASEVVTEQGGDPVERRSAERLPKQQGICLFRRPWRVGDKARKDLPRIGLRRVPAPCADEDLSERNQWRKAELVDV